MRTWQIFNKLTEEERPIYEKVFGGTLFTNLPPIPFDWQVRAAFSTREIPGVLSDSSAFGLGVLRIMKTLFPNAADLLQDLENKTVGEWYTRISEQLGRLEAQKQVVTEERSKTKRQQQRRRLSLYANFGILFLTVPALISSTDILFDVLHLPSLISRNLSSFTIALTSTAALLGLMLFMRARMKEIYEEENIDKEGETLQQIEEEIKRYRTLVLTDPRLREHARHHEEL